MNDPKSPSDSIDLRSDTVTQPDEPMWEAMRAAPLGDDVLDDDPTVHQIERLAAERFGKEAGLFTPSGTMANSIAIGALSKPGDELILESLCHSYNFECGGASRLWGVQVQPLPGENGLLNVDQIEAAVRPDNVHMPRTSLVVLEQTSNIAGGAILPHDKLGELSTFCRANGLRFHIDGARIFNAAVASGRDVAEYAALADSVMFCISKGLGAPAGSLLVGTRKLIEEGRRLRKLLGGGMRQSGILAGAGIYALQNNVDRLADDHRRCRELADSLAPLQERGLDAASPETNMLYLRWDGGSAADFQALAADLEEQGVRCFALMERGVRLVFHKDIDDDQAAQASERVAKALDRHLPKN